jgi:acyl carrier protein
MTESEIREAVFKVLGKIAPEADLARLRSDENLREALDIDSFDFLQFVIGLHESLKIEIPESDYPRLATLSGILQYVQATRA